MEEWELVTENKQNLLEEGGRVCRRKEGELEGGCRETLLEEGEPVIENKQNLLEEPWRACWRIKGKFVRGNMKRRR